MTASARLFNDWVTARGGSEPAEITTGLAAVRHFVQAHKTSRFTPWESPSLVIHNCAGFWQSKDNTFYIYPEAWKADVLAGQDASLIAQEMVRRGFLKANTDGKPQTKQRLPDGSERRVYVVLPAIFKGEP